MSVLRFGRTALCMATGLALASACLAQPANNSCANAIPVSAGTVSGTTIGATNDGAGTCGASATTADVWYSYVAPFDGTLVLSTCGGANYDSVLGIWNGCPSQGGAELACNDDACGTQSSVQIVMSAGDYYLIRVSGYNGATGAFTLTIDDQEGTGDPGGGTGPDVVYADITDVTHYGPVGTIHAYAYGTGTCNIGDTNLHWGNSWSGTPSVGFNAYRLYDGRLMQIGQSWVKRACCAAAGAGCSLTCNGQGGSVLGVGCKDSYSSGYNGSQGVLGRRSSLNPFTGAHALVGGSGNEIWGRLQVEQNDLTAASYPNALYFAEGVYVGADDAVAGNAHNNASYRRMVVGAGYNLTMTGVTQIGSGAIYAWRDNGFGPGVPDPGITVNPLDVPGEGRFIVGCRVRDLGSNTWRYDYAILNINSDVSGGALTIPLPAGTTVSNVGFHDVPYHSGEPYDNTDWVSTVGATSVTWASPQTHAQNPNSNALRWGTMYNFWFDADRPPATGTATLGLFKPFTPQSVDFSVHVPSSTLAGDLNHDGHVDLADLSMLLGDFGCSTPPCAGDVNSDGNTDLADLAALLANFGV